MTKKEYLNKMCDLFDCTHEYYIKDMDANYVILDCENKPLCFSNGDVVVYGDKYEAMDECEPDERVVTELEFFKLLK